MVFDQRAYQNGEQQEPTSNLLRSIPKILTLRCVTLEHGPSFLTQCLSTFMTMFFFGITNGFLHNVRGGPHVSLEGLTTPNVGYFRQMTDGALSSNVDC